MWVDPESGALKASLNRVGQIESDWLPVNNMDEIVHGAGNGAGVSFADVNGDGRVVRGLLTTKS